MNLPPETPAPRNHRSKVVQLLWVSSLPLIVWAFNTTTAFGATVQPAPPSPNLQPFLEKHCSECHDPDTKKGGLDFSKLPLDFSQRDLFDSWERVFDKVLRGDMPPKKKSHLSDSERNVALRMLGEGLLRACTTRQCNEGRVTFRRLNRTEYENTIHDLLAIDVPLKGILPEDNIAFGFDNIGASLDTSSVLMERYLEAADVALDAAAAPGFPPIAKKERFNYADLWPTLPVYLAGKTIKKLDDGIAMFGSEPRMGTLIKSFSAPADGLYRVKASVYAYQSDKSIIAVARGGQLFNTLTGDHHTIDYFLVPPGKPTILEFTDSLHWRGTFKVAPLRMESPGKEGADAYKGPGLAAQWIEIEGPLPGSWPPESRSRLFKELPLEPIEDAANKQLMNQAKTNPEKSAQILSRIKWDVKSSNPDADAARLLLDFATRAYRRPVREDEIADFVKMTKAHLREGDRFNEALRVGFKAILTSPDFLYFREAPGPLDGYALASRLSYFLWSAPPDTELLALAKTGALMQSEILRNQTERLLSHPKAANFVHNFLGQWLDLRKIDFTAPDKRMYPEFDDLLGRSMVRESEAFFQELLTNNLSIRNIIHADFAMLDQRLAEHYGIKGVEGLEIRKVPLPPNTHRGGILTQAAILKVSANGTSTSPVVRGAWVMDRILGVLPDPPPKAVAAIEPDIRGAKTIREQLDAHRHEDSCAGCHRKMDPLGFALENFDVIGGWRSRYRTVSTTAKKEDTFQLFDGERKVFLAHGLQVDSSSELADGTPFRDFEEFKKLLLRNQDQVARGLTGKLLTYATGAGVQFADRNVIEEILTKTRPKGYGLRTLIHEIVQSRPFRTK